MCTVKRIYYICNFRLDLEPGSTAIPFTPCRLLPSDITCNIYAVKILQSAS